MTPQFFFSYFSPLSLSLSACPSLSICPLSSPSVTSGRYFSLFLSHCLPVRLSPYVPSVLLQLLQAGTSPSFCLSVCLSVSLHMSPQFSFSYFKQVLLPLSLSLSACLSLSICRHSSPSVTSSTYFSFSLHACPSLSACLLVSVLVQPFLCPCW